MKSTLRPFGLTHVQFVLLASLWWLTEVADETPSQRRLADHAGTDPMMTSQVLRTLEARGLVNRSAHPTDSRTHQLAVTAAGSALAARAVIAVEEADQAFFVPAGGRRTITEFMRALAEL